MTGREQKVPKDLNIHNKIRKVQGGSYINIINNDEDKNIFQLNNNCMNIIENDKPQGKNLIELEFI